MGAQRDQGFALTEALVAAVLGAVILTAALSMLARHSRYADAHPDRADLQQRLRAAVDILTRELATAGAWGENGGAGPGLACCVPVVQPRRIGSRTPDPPGTARTDRLTIVRARPAAIGARLAQPLAAGDLWLAPGGGCPPADPACGVAADDHLLVYDATGRHDFLAADGPAFPIPVRPRQAGAPGMYPAGAAAVAVETRTVEFDAAQRQLRLYDGHLSDMPIVDHVASLRFDYWGTSDAPSRSRLEPGVETCWFDDGGLSRHGRVPSPPTAADVPLSLAVLSDGPWCGAGENRFDADLLRIRRIRVTLRLRAGSDLARGRGAEFADPGRASVADRLLPDLEVSFDVSPRAFSSD